MYLDSCVEELVRKDEVFCRVSADSTVGDCDEIDDVEAADAIYVSMRRLKASSICGP